MDPKGRSGQKVDPKGISKFRKIFVFKKKVDQGVEKVDRGAWRGGQFQRQGDPVCSHGFQVFLCVFPRRSCL